MSIGRKVLPPCPEKTLVLEIRRGFTQQRADSAAEATHISSESNVREGPSVSAPLTSIAVKGIQNAREQLVQQINAGDLSAAVIEAVLDGNGFLPIEGVLIDYKRDAPEDKYSECKLVKHVLAFHNTYGGYLIIGAEESEKDKVILPVFHTLAAIDSKKLRDLCREYLTAPIEVQSCVHTISTERGQFEVQLIHVPKRKSAEPIYTRREGAKNPKSQPAFAAEQVFFRDGDNSIPASTIGHWRLLWGPREPPYVTSDTLPLSPRTIWNNLPERGYICEEFIGRQDVLGSLFTWLADDFACVKVVAGEGGLGKTSVAYQFATEIARANMLRLESVVWLTAKRLQFRAMLNEYEELANPHFSNCRELFAELARNMGATDEEIEQATDLTFPRILRRLSEDVKIFAVIDDLDSLDINEQKRSIECCQQLAGTGSRFLFTTRKNATASTSTALELRGLSEEEYPELVHSWCDRLSITRFSKKDVERIWETTKGSPLYTESLLRLVKGGMTIGDANAKWRGNLGLEVRNAALKREVTQLPPEARKVLITVAILGECSIAEIKHFTEFSDTTIIDATNELQSLFLVHSPAIAEQKRFAVSNTTRALVMSLGPELQSGFGAYAQLLQDSRFKAKGNISIAKAVGTAINQATALLAAKEFDAALKTVDEINSRLGGKNADLLFMRGRVLLRYTVPKRSEAATAFAKAFDLGQRKPLFFHLWYEAEVDLENYERAVHVASEALAASVPTRADWLCRKASARIRSASSQEKRGDAEHAITQLKSAAHDLSNAFEIDSNLQWESIWQETMYLVHDRLWSISTKSASGVAPWLAALDIQISAIDRGDNRSETYYRLATALGAMNRTVSERGDSRSERVINLLSQSTRRALESFGHAPKQYALYSQFKLARKVVDCYATEFGLR